MLKSWIRLVLGLILIQSFMVQAQGKGATSFGSGLPTSQFVNIDEVLKNPKKYVGQKVAVKGKVKDICPMKGCWMNLQSETNQIVKVKVKDDVIVIPASAKGKQAAAYGKLIARELSKKSAIRYYKHLAEEKGEAFDPKSVKGPVTIYQIQGVGGEIYN